MICTFFRKFYITGKNNTIKPDAERSMAKEEERMDTMEDDGVLIQAYLAGDVSSFDTLYTRYKRPLYAYLNRMTGNHALADDLFQQTWIRVIRRLEKYESKQKFFAWLTMIAHNLAIDHFRKEKTSAELPLDDENIAVSEPVSHTEPWMKMHNRELEKALKAATEELAPELKEVFLLRQRGISFKEIAEVQNCSINTVLGRMQYAIRNLRKQLNEWVS